jgi:hypothetical protein
MALATHDGYSDRNACLIAMQDPEATDVSGFHTWLSRGRSVRKGEAGIMILAPAGHGTRKGEPAAEVPVEVPADGGEGDGRGGPDVVLPCGLRFRCQAN